MEWHQIVQEVLEPIGYRVVEAGFKGSPPVLTVKIEPQDEKPTSVADLERASAVLSLELDRIDPVAGPYQLVVESPGPKRPLINARDFERFAGLKVKVRSPTANFIARIASVNGEEVTFSLEDGSTQSLSLGNFQANLAEWPESHR